MLTILTPATNTRLTTVAAIKAEMGITSGADDAWFQDAIERASAAVRSWCNCIFTQETISQVIRLQHPEDSLMLTRVPVVSVDIIAVNGKELGAGDYEHDAATGLIYRLDAAGDHIRWPTGKVVVEYSAGFILPGDPGRTLPHDVERATLLLMKADYFGRQRDPLVKSENVSDALSTSYWVGGFRDGGTLPPEVEGLLSPYRHPAIG
ncbi:hypothetical protein [Magnetospirillum sp. 15-1]|uniref:hypothetical protein n=1 Tax=Magnetospirillum sp. 15-1 TaxID=1979370 RepID=UPI000BBBD1AC|nr:hypothetical protein [Magnetospirillum sp. 15-1]